MLPNTEYYLLGFEHPIIQTYYKILVDVSMLLGAEEATAKKDMRDLIEFEIKLAKVRVVNLRGGDVNFMVHYKATPLPDYHSAPRPEELLRDLQQDECGRVGKCCAGVQV